MVSRRAFLIGSLAALTASQLPVTTVAKDWHHIIYCKAGDYIKYFVDGELVGSEPFSGEDFTLQYWTNGMYLDEVRISR